MKTDTASKASTNYRDGKVVQIAGDQLTSTCSKGDEHHYTVAQNAKVTCDGKQGQLSDLKKGATIRMTMCKDEKDKVIAVDCGKHIPALVTA
jgi:hypothetical protein